MVPEGNQRPPARRAVALLVDATRSQSALPLFGMPLLERALRAALEAGLDGARVFLHEGESSVPLPPELEARFELVRVPDAGPLAKRIAVHAGGDHALLVLDADAVVDPRLLAHLAAREGSWAMRAPPPAVGVGTAGAVLRLEGAPRTLPEARGLPELAEAWCEAGDLAWEGPEAVPAHLKKLRRDLPTYVFRVGQEGERDLAERFLFESNYKGSTDFFTKHVYPPLVWAMVRPLARGRVHPNWISAFNVLITFAAIPLFAAGAWVPGLVAAYTMSVLDSVDGKLARLTYTSSKLGHVLDHGLDVVHPPLWYLAWAVGLGGGALTTAAWWMAAMYVADRLVTEAFTRMTGGRSIHAWAPIDVRARTWVSRRNINVPLFTLGLILGMAPAAFFAIVAWQGATLGFHALRLARVGLELFRGGRNGVDRETLA